MVHLKVDSFIKDGTQVDSAAETKIDSMSNSVVSGDKGDNFWACLKPLRVDMKWVIATAT